MSVILRQVTEDIPSRMNKVRQLHMDGQEDGKDYTEYFQLFSMAECRSSKLVLGTGSRALPAS